MSVRLLLLLGILLSAPVARAAPLWLIDGGLVLDATPSVNADRSELHPFLALRGGGLWPLASEDGTGLLLGADARLLVEAVPRVRGTADVGSISWELGLEPRALLAYRFGAGPLALAPYAFGGALLGARLIDVYAFDAHDLRGHPIAGARAGAGGLLLVGPVSLALELGGGVRERGAEVIAAVLAGGTF